MPISNPNEKHKCSGVTTKNKICKANGIIRIGSTWYCKAHENQAVPDAGTEEEDEEEESDGDNRNINLTPVVKTQEGTTDRLKKVACKKKTCDIFIMVGQEDSSWACPLHVLQKAKPDVIKEVIKKVEPEAPPANKEVINKEKATDIKEANDQIAKDVGKEKKGIEKIVT